MTDTPIKFKGVKAGHRLYLAYGSNLCKQAMRVRCPDARPVGTLLLENTRLVFRSVADVEYAEGCVTPVGVWSISASDERALDRYEGVASGYYWRYHIPVGDTRALIYFMHDRGIAPPGQHYFDTIKRGYRDFKLDMRYLNDALAHSHDQKQLSERIASYRRNNPSRHGNIVQVVTGEQS